MLGCGPKLYDVQGHPGMVVQQPVVSACSHAVMGHWITYVMTWQLQHLLHRHIYGQYVYVLVDHAT